MDKQLSPIDRIAVFCINALCLLLPLALFFGLFLLIGPAGLRRNEDTPLLYTVTLPAVRQEHIGGICLPATVTDAVSKRQIGELVGCEVAPAMTQSYSNRAGHMRLVEYPGHKTVTLTIRASGRAGAGGYSLGGYTLYRGAQVSLRLPNFVGTGVCTVLKPLPKEMEEPWNTEKADMSN